MTKYGTKYCFGSHDWNCTPREVFREPMCDIDILSQPAGKGIPSMLQCRVLSCWIRFFAESPLHLSWQTSFHHCPSWFSAFSPAIGNTVFCICLSLSSSRPQYPRHYCHEFLNIVRDGWHPLEGDTQHFTSASRFVLCQGHGNTWESFKRNQQVDVFLANSSVTYHRCFTVNCCFDAVCGIILSFCKNKVVTHQSLREV